MFVVEFVNYTIILTIIICFVIKNQFDVDISQPHIKRYIKYEIGTLFKEYRSALYKHYQKYANPIEARRNPHKYTTPNDWNMLCDRWECSSWKVNNNSGLILSRTYLYEKF